MLHNLKKALLALSCGVLFMFPAFTAVASDQLLTDFTYSAQPMDVSQNVAHALMEKNGAIVIDVRTPEEYAAGHIEGAYNFPVEELHKHYGELAILKENNTPVLLYCRSGRRSGNAMMQLHKEGFSYLMNMGGVLTWEYGLTTDKTSKPFAEAVKAVTRYQP